MHPNYQSVKKLLATKKAKDALEGKKVDSLFKQLHNLDKAPDSPQLREKKEHLNNEIWTEILFEGAMMELQDKLKEV